MDIITGEKRYVVVKQERVKLLHNNKECVRNDMKG
jgi:hypothetical protein